MTNVKSDIIVLKLSIDMPAETGKLITRDINIFDNIQKVRFRFL